MWQEAHLQMGKLTFMEERMFISQIFGDRRFCTTPQTSEAPLEC